MTIPLTAKLSDDQNIGQMVGRRTQEAENNKGITLRTTDVGPAADYVIYVYNLLAKEHVVEQPPNFPRFVIPACEEGMKFSVTTLPAYVNNKFNKPGTTEYRTEREDGRRYATCLLNPGAFPVTDVRAQLLEYKSLDQTGNNLNVFGVFWSLTRPDDPALEKEIKLFTDRCTKTMNGLVKEAEKHNAAGKRERISPWMHFAMDYLGLQAPWHMSNERHMACPNCGESVRDGIAYHKNSMGDRCIIDIGRYATLGLPMPSEVDDAPEKPAKKRKTATVSPAA